MTGRLRHPYADRQMNRPPTSDGSNPGRCELGLLVLILVIGAALRIGYLAEIRHDPGLEHPTVDAGFNLYWARGLATGDWTLPPDANGRDPSIRETSYQRPPGYPMVLSVLYRITGGDSIPIRAIQMLGGLAAVLLSWRIGRRLFSKGVGLWWAAFMAVHWGFIYFEAGLNGAWLVNILLLLLVGALHRMVLSGHVTYAALTGLLVGLTALVRTNSLVLGPVLGIWMVIVLVRRFNGKRAATCLAVSGLAGLLTLAPVTVRNLRVSGELVPVSGNGGLTLYHGNNPTAAGYSAAASGDAGFFSSPWHSADLRARESRAAGRELSYTETSRRMGAVARDWMTANPGKAMRLVGTRAALFWGPDEIAHSTPVAADRQASALLSVLPFKFALTLAGGLWGIVFFAAGRRAGNLDPLADGVPEVLAAIGLVVAAWFVSFLPFFVTSLYRTAVVPFLLMAMAVGAMATVGFFRCGRRGTAVLGLGTLVILWAVFRIPVVPVDPGLTERHVQRGTQWRFSGNAVRAEDEFRAALQTAPQSAAARNGLAAVLLDGGRPAEAEPLLVAAVQANPADPLPHFNLGLARFQLGRWPDAASAFGSAVEIAPNLVQGHVLLGASLERMGDMAGAAASYGRVLELEPDHLEAANNLAWLLATAPDNDLRDGTRAVNLAHVVVAALRNPATLDTLAAALAQAGRFDEAVVVMEEALLLNASVGTIANEELEARVSLYRAGKAYRQPDAGFSLLQK